MGKILQHLRIFCAFVGVDSISARQKRLDESIWNAPLQAKTVLCRRFCVCVVIFPLDFLKNQKERGLNVMMINLEKEIREQPGVLYGVIAANLETVRNIVADIKAAGVTNVQLAARGTSDHACIYAQYLLHTLVGVPCGLATPSAITKYNGKLSFAKTLVIGVSQSGKAADVMSVIERANETGAITLAITNYPDSPLAKTAKYHLCCNAGEESSIAATKTFTSQMMTLALLAAVWADDFRFLAALSGIYNDAAKLLEYMPEKVKELAEARKDMTGGVVLGRGFAYPIACEAHLKILETNGIKMRGYAVSDFHHGPKAQIHEGDVAFVIALKGAVEDDAIEMINTLVDLKADIIVITDDAELAKREGISALLLPNNSTYEMPDAISAFTAAITMQLWALELALVRGVDPDATKVLKKVTITK